MPADITDIRKALAAALAPLRIQTSPWVLAEPTPPCAYLTVGPEEYDRAMGRGHNDYVFVVVALVGLATDVGAQMELGTLMAESGERSVKTLLEADRTLGGLVHAVHVTERTGERVYRSGAPTIGCEWTVHVRG